MATTVSSSLWSLHRRISNVSEASTTTELGASVTSSLPTEISVGCNGTEGDSSVGGSGSAVTLASAAGGSTTIGPAYYPAHLPPAVTAACALLLVVGVVGNLLVPAVVWRTRELRSSTNLFLVNLSVADLLVLLVCMPPALVEVHAPPDVWLLGPAMCKLVPFVELTVAHASVLTILAISFERYYAICQPLRAGYTCTRMRALAVCLGVWLAAMLSTSPMLAIAEYQQLPSSDCNSRDLVPICLTQALTFWSSCYFLAVISIFFFLPFIILVILYVIIASHLMADPGTTGNNPHLRSRKQVVVMLATVVFVFFCCLLPFRLLTLCIILLPHETLLSIGVATYYNLLYFCRIMLYLNSAVNPILYNVMSSKFREAFCRLLSVALGRTRLGRHLSRQSTFNTTSSSLPQGSSLKSTKSGDSIRVVEFLFQQRHGNLQNACGRQYSNGVPRKMTIAGRRQKSVDEVLLQTTRMPTPTTGSSGVDGGGGASANQRRDRMAAFARANSVV